MVTSEIVEFGQAMTAREIAKFDMVASLKKTGGFAQATCDGSIQKATRVGFWCDWGHGDGAVLMIGGGGKDCQRADHGMGITEADKASFFSGGEGEHDFGDGRAGSKSKTYSLNLWIN